MGINNLLCIILKLRNIQRPIAYSKKLLQKQIVTQEYFTTLDNCIRETSKMINVLQLWKEA